MAKPDLPWISLPGQVRQTVGAIDCSTKTMDASVEYHGVQPTDCMDNGPVPCSGVP